MSRVTMVREKTGPKPTITDEIVADIRTYVLQGLPYTEIAKHVGVNYKTLNYWRYKNIGQLADQIQTWEMERTLELAEAVGRQILTMVDVKDDGTINPALKAIKQREAEYVRDALVIARKKWSKRDAVNINVQLPQPILGDLFNSLPKVAIIEQPKSLVE